MDVRPVDDPNIWDAIRRGKLIVRGASGYVYYGEDLIEEWKECARNGQPFPGVVVERMTDEAWEPFAEHYQLDEPTTDRE
jgi:hypothetical protein